MVVLEPLSCDKKIAEVGFFSQAPDSSLMVRKTSDMPRWTFYRIGTELVLLKTLKVMKNKKILRNSQIRGDLGVWTAKCSVDPRTASCEEDKWENQ